jgi:hypothetical protein
MLQTANRNLRKTHHLDGKIKHPDCSPKFEKFQNCFSDMEIVDCPDAQGCHLDARARDSNSN